MTKSVWKATGAIICLFLITVIIRLYFAIKTPVVGDSREAYKIGSMALRGVSLEKFYYGALPYAYNNPPALLYLLVGQVWIEKTIHIPFPIANKLAATVADGLIAVLLFKLISEKEKLSKKFAYGLFYALNPVSILITGFHGQHDALPTLATLAAVYIFPRYMLLGALFLGLGMAFKPFPVLLLPLFLFMRPIAWRKRVQFTLLSMVPLFLAFAPLWITAFGMVNRGILIYSGSPDYGWLSLIRTAYWLSHHAIYVPLPNIDLLLSISKYVFLSAYVLVVITMLRRKTVNPITGAISLVYFLFYFVYGGIASQYLVWLLPFLILYNRRYAFAYTIIATTALLGYYAFFLPRLFLWAVPFFLVPVQVEESVKMTVFSQFGVLTPNIPLYRQITAVFSLYTLTSIVFWPSTGFFLWRLIQDCKLTVKVGERMKKFRNSHGWRR